ncbi:MAG: hypothetical protein OEY01_03395 [Desulfobulbaceae bacterium]|nr:hypothetical protein [Desulfobulbaceae bacterium]
MTTDNNTATAKTEVVLTATQAALIEMLTENTGVHFLDSGGVYGRGWQRAQGRDFLSEPDATLDKWGTLSVSLFHFLDRVLEFDEEVNQVFEDWCDLNEEGGLGAMKPYLDYLVECGYEGIFGDDPEIYNIYNGEHAVDQIFQYFCWVGDDGDTYVCLSIHGGCDARGGYTDCKIFREIEEHGIHDVARGGLYCEADGCDAGWYTDSGGYNWYGNNQERDFKDPTPERDEDGEETGKFLCPCCGKATLKASMY